MKLDRNTNKDGKGKYALLNLRTGQMQWGNESPGEQFFVMKYKDRFTAAGLAGYANGIREYIRNARSAGCDNDHVRDMEEFADEIDREAKKAAALGEKCPD